MTAKFHSPLLGQLTANFAEFKIRRELFRDDDIICFFGPERAAIAIVPNRLIYITSVFHFGRLSKWYGSIPSFCKLTPIHLNGAKKQTARISRFGATASGYGCLVGFTDGMATLNGAATRAKASRRRGQADETTIGEREV